MGLSPAQLWNTISGTTLPENIAYKPAQPEVIAEPS